MYIVSWFTTRPPRESEIVDIAWRKYCKAMIHKLVDSLAIFVEYGRRSEKQ